MLLSKQFSSYKFQRDSDFQLMIICYALAIVTTILFWQLCQLRVSSINTDSLVNVFYDTLSCATVSIVCLCLGYYYSKRYFFREQLNGHEQAQKVLKELRYLKIEIKNTSDLSKVLERGEEELFNRIKQTTITLLFPSNPTKIAAVEKMFAAIHHCYFENQRSIDNHVNITIPKGKRNITFESSYYNKVINGDYPSANRALKWLNKTNNIF